MGAHRPLPPVLTPPRPLAPRGCLAPTPPERGLDLRRAVVTGPTGALGVHLIDELIAHNVAVFAVCRPDSARLGNIPSHPLVTVVPCALSALSSLPENIGAPCDAFFHLAWDGPFGPARNDAALQQANVAYTLDAVRAASALLCKAFVGAGSQSEFGPVNGVLSPELPCHPDTEYGRAKLAAGEQSRALCHALGIRQCWCRILSVYGPFDGEYTMVMSVIRQLLLRTRPQCTAGEQLWDYLYARDAARALRLVAALGRPGAVYCLGGGQPRSLRDYICAIRDAIDPSLPIGFGERPYNPHQVMHLAADLTALTADTGFLPRVTFEQGITETVAWARQRMQQA